MVRTKIDIDDELIKEAMRLTGARTENDAVDLALRRLVAKGSLFRSLRKLRGTLAWKGNVDRWRRARTERG